MLGVLGSGRLAAALTFELGGCTSAATCSEQPAGFVEARAGQPVLLVVVAVGAMPRYLAAALASFAWRTANWVAAVGSAHQADEQFAARCYLRFLNAP